MIDLIDLRPSPNVRRALAVAALAVVATAATAPAVNTVDLRLCDGYDFPVGPPDSSGYYKARGFWPNGHLGEDWNGRGGGNTDLGDPVYACADGIVVHSRDVHVGWGNVVIIRHAYRENDGTVKVVDSLYGHLNERFVTLNQRVRRGQKIGTIGTNHGMYYAHLHFEIRKNLNIGMNRSSFDRTFRSYHDPTKFINAHRRLKTAKRDYAVPINTFAPYGKKIAVSQRLTPAAPLGRAAEEEDERPKPSGKIPVDDSLRGRIQHLVEAATSGKWKPPAADSRPRVARAANAESAGHPLPAEVLQVLRETRKSLQDAAEDAEEFWERFREEIRPSGE